MIRQNKDISRRDALRLFAGAAVPGSYFLGQEQEQGQQSGQAGELAWPNLAGPARDRTTDWDNDPFIIGIEVQLRCMCGCNQSIYQCRTTDFTCPLWPVTHAQIISMVEEGATAQQVIDAFIAENGEEVLMAPKAEGFNVAGYVLPGALIATVGSLLLFILGRKHRLAAARAEAGQSNSEVPTDLSRVELSEEDEETLKEELNKLEL